MSGEFPEVRYADSDGVSIAYEVRGDGPLDLVMLPSAQASLMASTVDLVLDQFLDQCASFARLIRLDNPRDSARASSVRDAGGVAAHEVDEYLAGLDEPKRSTLLRLRTAILEVVPDAEQGMSYGVPAFKVLGRTVAGFAAYKHHLSYLPHSGSVLAELGEDVAGYETSKGALRFRVDEPLPQPLVRKLVVARIRELHLDVDAVDGQADGPDGGTPRRLDR